MTQEEKNTVQSMSDDSPRNAEDDLALIRQMMEAGRRKVAVSGIHFIIWGFTLTAAFTAQYLSIVGVLPKTMLGIWIPAFVIGTAAEIFAESKISKPGGESIPHKVHGSAWEAVGVTALIYFIIAFAADSFEPRVISSINAATMGAAYYIASQVTGVRWLMLPALGWWAVLGYIAYVPTYGPHMLLVMAISALLLLGIPGMMMRRLTEAEG